MAGLAPELVEAAREVLAAGLLEAGSVVQLEKGTIVSLFGFDSSRLNGPTQIRLSEPVQVLGQTPNVGSAEETVGMVLTPVSISTEEGVAPMTYGEGYYDAPLYIPAGTRMKIISVSAGSTVEAPEEQPVTETPAPQEDGRVQETMPYRAQPGEEFPAEEEEEPSWWSKNWKAVLVLGALGVGVLWLIRKSSKETMMISTRI